MQPPEPRDGLGVDQLEDAFLAIRPFDVAGTGILVLQQLQQELPKVGGRALSRFPLHGNAIGADFGLASFLFQLLQRGL